MIYAWKPQSQIKADPQKAGALMESMEGAQRLTAANLLDESRPEDAVLHNEFEWNDSIAAEEYRLTQARLILRAIVIAPDKKEDTPVRAFFPVESAPTQYKSITAIVNSPDDKEYLLKTALSELRAFKAKYNSLQALSDVFNAIESVQRLAG